MAAQTNSIMPLYVDPKQCLTDFVHFVSCGVRNSSFFLRPACRVSYMLFRLMTLELVIGQMSYHHNVFHLPAEPASLETSSRISNYPFHYLHTSSLVSSRTRLFSVILALSFLALVTLYVHKTLLSSPSW